MARPPILNPDETYTFSRYFDLPFAPGEVLAELGCSLERTRVSLPKSSQPLDLDAFQKRLERNLTRVDLTSEAARRETLIAPILLEVCNYADASLNIEYPVSVNRLLRGTLDYYITAQRTLLVIEAKQADLTRGFTQLAVELIALDHWAQAETPTLYGAVTTGDIWRFGVLDRANRTISQDLSLYRAPDDLDALMSILLGILLGDI